MPHDFTEGRSLNGALGHYGHYLTYAVRALMFVLATACAKPNTTAAGPTYSLRVTEDTVLFSSTPEWKSFTVTALIRNHGPGALYAHWCTASAQREIDSVWTTVWSAPCLSDLTGPDAIAPGDSLIRTLSVGGYTTPGKLMELDPRVVSGKYRIEFAISFGVEDGTMTGVPPQEQRVTNTFVVREP